LSVNVDDEGGAYAAAAYLLERGHRDIACLTFEMDYSTAHPEKVYGVGQRRLKGYKRAFADFSVPWRDDRLISAFTSVAAGAEAFETLWQSGMRPTAILAIADIIAIGVLQAANNLSLRVPDDLAVIGFDDIPQAMWTTPTLTTVHQPTMEKGEIAAQQLLGLISGETPAELKIQLSTRLIPRQSA
jgi:DNA-binding LacI/PurR family transcriptional regulator